MSQEKFNTIHNTEQENPKEKAEEFEKVASEESRCPSPVIPTQH